MSIPDSRSKRWLSPFERVRMAVLARTIGDPLGQVIVVEADIHLDVGAVVLVDAAGQALQCEVVADQAQVRHVGVESTGRVLRQLPSEESGDEKDVEDVLDAHAASCMPWLSSEVRIGGRIGRVVRIDVPKRVVTVELEQGDFVSVGVADLDL